ncbi:MAG: nucleosidase [Nocardioides sp.]|uniref:nucleosidase n=1 Tax=Nocardioides sp. TaxID=35761 RepID=UPI0039E2A520
MTGRGDVLVVSATPEEAAYVPDGYPLLITGVGKVAAATAVATELARRPGTRLVVNIGSAGALRDGLEGLHEVGRVLNHDLSAQALRSFGYDPQEWLEVGEGTVSLATGDMFVSDPAVRAELARRADLVDMEGYAIAWAARAAGVTVRLVKHVSDNADASALSWLEVVDRSARALGEWLEAR